jgi:hypothetical protein
MSLPISPLYSQKELPDSHLTAGRVAPRAGMNAMPKKEIPTAARNQTAYVIVQACCS